MNNPFIHINENGTPVFLGKEDPNNPPVSPQEGSKMTCPVCGGLFDYLVGENTSDGGVQGCEKCWKAPGGNEQTKQPVQRYNSPTQTVQRDEGKEVISGTGEDFEEIIS